jgi:hypothetical protein
MLSKAKLVEGMTLLCEMVGHEASEFLYRAYYTVLQDLTDEQFEKAVIEALRVQKWSKLPMPGQLLEYIHGKPEDMALIALEKVERAFSQAGCYRSVVFDDPLIHGVIQAMGGWHTFAMELDEWTFRRKDFLKTYQAFTGKNVPTPLRLAGRAELDPHNKGRRVEVEYIGDRAKALAWTSERKKQELGHEQQEDVKQLIQGIAK